MLHVYLSMAFLQMDQGFFKDYIYIQWNALKWLIDFENIINLPFKM